MKHCGAKIGMHPALVKHMLEAKQIDPDAASEDQITEATEEARDAYEAMIYLCSLNRDRYQGMMDELTNVYLRDRDDYPKNLVAAHKMVVEWRGSSRRTDGGRNNNGVNFLQEGGENEDESSAETLTTKKSGTKARWHPRQMQHL